MIGDSTGFLYPEIDTKKCINCHICENICPLPKNIKRNGENIDVAFDYNYPPPPNIHTTIQEVFAVINNNEIIRKDSTSGGIFSLFAEKIIGQKGIVFGAQFDKDFSVIHSYTDNLEGIGKYRGSKYVQSRTGETYKECKRFLDDGRVVIFSGTPCQISGLKAYLQKEYSNLFCIDIICHSVPSPKVWKKYIEYRETVSGSKIEKIAFRYKKPSWKSSSIVFQFQNNTEYRKNKNDPFLRIFYSGICTRLSCYQCNYRTLNRESDITMADFWGVERVCPEMFDNKGTSLVLIHSSKGKLLFDSVKSECKITTIPIKLAIEYNPAISSNVIKKHKKRDLFFQNLEKFSLNILLNKYLNSSILARGYRFIQHCLEKI
jgi:coenzyme F420-reducing hydrogenase beta subunit